MRPSILVTLLLSVLSVTALHAQNNKMIYSVEDCDEEEGRIVVKTEIWDARPGAEERLVCSMGVDCQGKAWSACGTLATGNERIATLNAMYAGLVSGDSARLAATDLLNHITEIILRDGVAYVRSDRHVYYKVFNIGKGTVVFDDPRLARAGTMVALATPDSPSGPHIAVAYDGQTDRVMGYKVYMR